MRSRLIPCILIMAVILTHTSAFGLEFLLARPVILNVTATELLGAPQSVQSIDLGSESLLVSSSSVTTSLTESTAPFNDTVRKTYQRNIFVTLFDNNEAPCDAMLSVTASVEDNFGNPDRATNVMQPSSFVNLIYNPVEERRTCRGNGSLRRVIYRGDFVISGIINAGAAGPYEGLITIDISYP